MKIGKIYNINSNKNNYKQNLQVSLFIANRNNKDSVCFSGKKDKDTRPLRERFLLAIGLCDTTSPLHEAKTAEETRQILQPIKRDKELRDVLLFDNANYSLPIHLAQSAEQTRALLDASPNEKVLTKQLLGENNEREIPLHLARTAEQTTALLDASPNEETLKKQLLYRGIENYIPLHYAKGKEQIEVLLNASPDEETKLKQLTAKASDGSLPIHMIRGDEEKAILLNASPNDKVKFEQLVAHDDENNPPADKPDDICVRTAYELATTSEELTDIEKDELLVTYVNYVKDPEFSENYMKEYSRSIKEFLES